MIEQTAQGPEWLLIVAVICFTLGIMARQTINRIDKDK